MRIDKEHEFEFENTNLEDFRLIQSNSGPGFDTFSDDSRITKKQSVTIGSKPRKMNAKDAKCLGLTELFVGFSGETAKKREERITRAKEICQTCVLIEPCKQEAYEKPEVGVRGGESEVDRYLNGAPVDTISPEIVHYQRSIGERSS